MLNVHMALPAHRRIEEPASWLCCRHSRHVVTAWGAPQAWVGAPAIYVFDCSAAGLILNSFRAFAEQRAHVRLPLG